MTVAALLAMVMRCSTIDRNFSRRKWGKITLWLPRSSHPCDWTRILQLLTT